MKHGSNLMKTVTLFDFSNELFGFEQVFYLVGYDLISLLVKCLLLLLY